MKGSTLYFQYIVLVKTQGSIRLNFYSQITKLIGINSHSNKECEGKSGRVLTTLKTKCFISTEEAEKCLPTLKIKGWLYGKGGLKYGRNWGLGERTRRRMGRVNKAEKLNANSMQVFGWELRLAGALTVNCLSVSLSLPSSFFFFKAGIVY